MDEADGKASGQDRGAAGRRPPVILLSSPALPGRLAALLRFHVPLVLMPEAVTPTVLARLGPPAVVLALFCPVTDPVRILLRLERAGYRGRVALLSPPLPDARMPERELRASFPRLRLWVVVLPDLPFG